MLITCVTSWTRFAETSYSVKDLTLFITIIAPTIDHHRPHPQIHALKATPSKPRHQSHALKVTPSNSRPYLSRMKSLVHSWFIFVYNTSIAYLCLSCGCVSPAALPVHFSSVHVSSDPSPQVEAVVAGGCRWLQVETVVAGGCRWLQVEVVVAGITRFMATWRSNSSQLAFQQTVKKSSQRQWII